MSSGCRQPADRPSSDLSSSHCTREVAAGVLHHDLQLSAPRGSAAVLGVMPAAPRVRMMQALALQLRQSSPTWPRLRWSLPASSIWLIVAALAVVPPAASELSHAADVGTLPHSPSRASCVLGGDSGAGADCCHSLHPRLGIAYKSVRLLR
jgi:hypothetical protein